MDYLYKVYYTVKPTEESKKYNIPEREITGEDIAYAREKSVTYDHLNTVIPDRDHLNQSKKYDFNDYRGEDLVNEGDMDEVAIDITIDWLTSLYKDRVITEDMADSGVEIYTNGGKKVKHGPWGLRNVYYHLSYNDEDKDRLAKALGIN